jgi:L-asparaginase II
MAESWPHIIKETKPMSDPVLVEVLRGISVESRHRGAVAVLDAKGKVVLALGDIDRPVFPRSAIKGLQAIPLIESGAADKYGLTDQEIALACASHNGEEEHTRTALAMLLKSGHDVGSLECGAHWPMRDLAQHPLHKAGLQASALHNNCSGKHAGFVCVACASGDDPAGYINAAHPTMKTVTQAIADMTGVDLADAAVGTDGCSIPTYAIPLRAMALAFARFGTGFGLEPHRAAAVSRIRKSVAKAPFHVAGTDRFDTIAMQALGERAFLKTGAEGVYCAALPEHGFGVALKCEDGNGRAAQVMMAAVLKRFLAFSQTENKALQPLLEPQMKNWNGILVGSIRAAGQLSQ